MTLYGTSPHRKVVSETAPLTVAGPGAGEDDDATRRCSSAGRSSTWRDRRRSTTSVERKVYDRKGKLLYDDHWSSHYRGDYRLVRVGSKKPPPKKKPPVTTTTTADDHDHQTTTTAATTTTTPTTTLP